jgi:hypothetical protein
MTQPALAVGLRSRGRHYPHPPADPSAWPTNRWGSLDPESLPDGYDFYPSVTNVLSVLDKPGLKFWAAEMALRELYDSGSIPLDVATAVGNHKTACNRVARKRADAGTRAHTIAERLTLDLPLPSSLSDEDAAYAEAFETFWADYQPDPVSVEATIYGKGYAGTADLLAKIPVDFSYQVTIVDYKTRGERDDTKIARYGLLYNENRLQLAALSRGRYLAELSDGTWGLVALPEVTAALGVVLFPDGSYQTEQLSGADLDRYYAAFLGALQLWEGING